MKKPSLLFRISFISIISVFQFQGVLVLAATPSSGPAAIESFVRSISVQPIDKVHSDQSYDKAQYQEISDSGHRYVEAQDGRVDTNTMEEIISDNPYAKNLWPGALIQGASLDTGDFTPIMLPRARGRITVVDLNLADNVKWSAIMANPSLASYQRALTSILSQKLGAQQPAKIFSSYATYKSADQSALDLGISASWLSGNLRSSLSMADMQGTSRLIFKYVQAYYTVVYDSPNGDSPRDFFGPNASLNEAHRVMYAAAPGRPNNPPAYVSEVVYGRQLFVLVSSNHSESELHAALDVAAGGIGYSGNVSFSDAQKKVLDESDIKVVVWGGNGEAATYALNGKGTADSLANYINTGINYSKDNPGLPISYTLLYLKDGSPALVQSSTKYPSPRTELPHLTNVTVTWNTPSGDNTDNKDDNTGVLATIAARGSNVTYASWQEPKDQNNQEFPKNNSCFTKTLNVAQPIYLTDLPNLDFQVAIDPHGHDTWTFNYIVRASVEGSDPENPKTQVPQSFGVMRTGLRLDQDHTTNVQSLVGPLPAPGMCH